MKMALIRPIRGQLTLEFLMITAGLLAVYAVVLPSSLSSFQRSSNVFDSNAGASIVSAMIWKANEVNLFESGSQLSGKFNSPLEFNFSIENNVVRAPFNVSIAPDNIGDAQFEVKRGDNLFTFLKTNSGVSIQPNK